MPRPTSRARLENGLKLNISRLQRGGFIAHGKITGPIGFSWHHGYWGEIANGLIWSSMQPENNCNFVRVRIGALDQRIELVCDARHFGGVQWYFICPVTLRRARVLWKPPGADRFCSRQTWGRQVAYSSQCLSTTDRIWRTKSKIKGRLIADLDPDEWDFPPKPKGMRWKTYQRYERWFDRLEEKLDDDINRTVARLWPILKKIV